VAFLNHDWRSEEITHWCCPGCCESEQTSLERCLRLFNKIGMRIPDTPLLYRWKHFEPACSFALRGILVHRYLPLAFGPALCKQKD
jgi:hypothetical protein